MKYLVILSMLFAIWGFRFSHDAATTIYGTVVDNNNKPIAGASITLEGTQTGVAANARGHFSITVPGDSVTLVIAAIGYQSKEVLAIAGNKLQVTLNAAVTELNDVVVVGYGTALKRRVPGLAVGAVSTQRFSAPALVKGEEQKSYNHIIDKDAAFNREGYEAITENPFRKVEDAPLSTFSIDVDAASYSNIRRFINSNQLPPAGAVRIEEMINYFPYPYPQPAANQPFSVNTELAACPWNSDHQLLLVGLQGKTIPYENLPPGNLVFLVDVSGSMMEEDKLPLVKASLKLLTDQLRPQDKVAIVTYAGTPGLVLPSTSGANKTAIKEAIDNMEAGGSTAGGAGIELAYKTARANFAEKGNNRVILCTDGDFNVGESSDDALERMIEKQRAGGVFLTVLGYGTGNYQDAKMQKLADKGNGNHAYIDGVGEAKKVLIHEFGGTLFTIAKDVKLQLEFNPAHVQGYRLIGYENRMLAKEDFNNDKKDAGELGSGHTVTALYEIIPQGVDADELQTVDELRYQQPAKHSKPSFKDELVTIKLRYKQPGGDTSSLLSVPVKNNALSFNKASDNLRFASAVAAFGMQLRGSAYKGNTSYQSILSIASHALGDDAAHYRSEFTTLVKKASRLELSNRNPINNDDDE